jgi:serine/threonine-protein kinase
MEENLVGTTLGQYQVVGELGRGGMATVYKGYQPRLEREVAIKVLPAYFAHDPQFSERFRREAKAIANLDHPNVVPVYDSGEERGVPYIVMKHVEGGSLKSRLERGRPDLKYTAHIISQVASALSYAHGQGVIHRDVKPSNVLMTGDDWAQLSDFGIAKMTAETQALTGTGVGVGTPEYMAPEQASEAARVDERADVYSLGVMVYQMVTGKLPYTGSTPMGVVIKHMQAPLPLVREVAPDVPEDVERVILKAMAKDPDDRFQTPNDLSDALEAAVVGQPITVELPPIEADLTGTTLPIVARKETRPHPVPRTLVAWRGKRLLWTGVAGTVVAAAAIAIALTMVVPGSVRRNQEATAIAQEEATAVAQEEATSASQVEATATAPQETPTTPPEERVEAVLDEWPLVLYDSFDTNDNHWEDGESTNERASIDYLVGDGKYRWEVEVVDEINWFYWNEEIEPVSDFYFAVEGKQLGEAINVNYGVIFRSIDTAAYLFSINDVVQQYGLLRWDIEGWTYLIDGTRHSAIRRGESNRLAVLGEGSHFVFYINDQYVDEIVVDGGLTSGRVGLAIAMFDGGGEAVFEFDNFELYAPQG